MPSIRRRTFLFAIAAVALGGRISHADSSLKIGVIGAGRIGGTVGGLWAKAGHEVLFADRDPEQAKRAAQFAGARASMGAPAEAAAFGDAVLIAVPYGALPAVAKEVGAALKGKVVLDPNNPFAGRDGDIAAKARNKGAGMTTAELLPGARVVRAFNHVGAASLQSEAHRAAPRVAIVVGGDDPAAVKIAARLVQDAGFEPVVLGSLAATRASDPGSPVFGRAMTAAELRQAIKR